MLYSKKVGHMSHGVVHADGVGYVQWHVVLPVGGSGYNLDSKGWDDPEPRSCSSLFFLAVLYGVKSTLFSLM